MSISNEKRPAVRDARPKIAVANRKTLSNNEIHLIAKALADSRSIFTGRRRMNGTARKFAMVLMLLGLAAMASTTQPFAQDTDQSQATILSKAEAANVDRQIMILRNPGEWRMAAGWSDAKKVAEMICRPAALRVLQKQNKAVDRVFLGTDDPTSLTLESNARLTGTGEYRTPQGWQNISFVCEVKPATANVTRFQSTRLPAQ
jgi:hypothetical protein